MTRHKPPLFLYYCLLWSLGLHLFFLLGLSGLAPSAVITTNANPSLNLKLAMIPHKKVPLHQSKVQLATKIKPKLAVVPQITQIASPTILSVTAQNTPQKQQTTLMLEETTQQSHAADHTNDNLQTTESPIQEPIFDAAFLHNQPPAYPAFAQRRGQQGMVLLRVKVSVEGKAEAVELNQSSGFKLLDEAAQSTVKKWRFVPAKQGDISISAWVIVPIEFKLS